MMPSWSGSSWCSQGSQLFQSFFWDISTLSSKSLIMVTYSNCWHSKHKISHICFNHYLSREEVGMSKGDFLFMPSDYLRGQSFPKVLDRAELGNMLVDQTQSKRNEIVIWFKSIMILFF